MRERERERERESFCAEKCLLRLRVRMTRPDIRQPVCIKVLLNRKVLLGFPVSHRIRYKQMDFS